MIQSADSYFSSEVTPHTSNGAYIGDAETFKFHKMFATTRTFHTRTFQEVSINSLLEVIPGVQNHIECLEYSSFRRSPKQQCMINQLCKHCVMSSFCSFLSFGLINLFMWGAPLQAERFSALWHPMRSLPERTWIHLRVQSKMARSGPQRHLRGSEARNPLPELLEVTFMVIARTDTKHGGAGGGRTTPRRLPGGVQEGSSDLFGKGSWNLKTGECGGSYSLPVWSPLVHAMPSGSVWVSFQVYRYSSIGRSTSTDFKKNHIF